MLMYIRQIIYFTRYLCVSFLELCPGPKSPGYGMFVRDTVNDIIVDPIVLSLTVYKCKLVQKLNSSYFNFKN